MNKRYLIEINSKDSTFGYTVYIATEVKGKIELENKGDYPSLLTAIKVIDMLKKEV